ncbi:hypothetical protein OM076_27630 [Solirubrobacter ginsenosidimutans]|uniref:DUF4185 domain-containing protein n=1 Tax=Solirubrobacter ginsenosidimutans TaxID=490573 RepID=A0A9X3MZE1_9ACTN|nr:hypothetical protein [Solirubrobacter ginsenosidimutans]MDA0164075.1 hypothetical protein [Solirubrobacter ginsenosidimutans]
MRRRHITAALAVALSLVAAAPAAADSISYLRDGNIWLTTPDGARQFQVTSTGIYSYASQADDGTFIALTGERLHRLSRDGKVLADFDTPVSDGPKKGPNENYFMGPYEPEISPDGQLVSYSYAWHHERYDYDCKCVRFGTDSGTAISYPDRQTAWEEFGGPLTGWMFGSWMSNDTLLRSYAGRAFAEEAVVNRIGPGKGDDDMIRWLDSTFDMDEVYQFRDGEITRKGDKAAFVSYDVAHHGEPYRTGFNRVRVYRLGGAPPARPESCFYFDGPDTADLMSSPSFSPDGSMLAMQFGGAISIADIPDLSSGCQSPTFFKDLIAGAQPDWGPADVPLPVGPVTEPPKSAPGTATDAAKRPAIGLTLPKRIKLRTALREGIAVTVNSGAAGRVTATAKLKRSKLGSGAAKVGARGKAKVRIRFTPKAARLLHERRSARLTLALRFTPAGGGPSVTRSVSLTLKGH